MAVEEPVPIARRLGVTLPFHIFEWRNEMELQARMAVSLAREGGHRVYLHHAAAARIARMPQFSVHGASCRVDLLVVTRKGWSKYRPENHEEMPCVGIEVKLAKNLKWLRDGFNQLHGYIDASLSATYKAEGRQLPSPTHFLIATDHSWEAGHLYRWWDEVRLAPPRWVKACAEAWHCPEDQATAILMEHAWDAQQLVWDSVLLEMGTSVLKGTDATFETNRFGARRLYTLNDASPRLGGGW